MLTCFLPLDIAFKRQTGQQSVAAALQKPHRIVLQKHMAKFKTFHTEPSSLLRHMDGICPCASRSFSRMGKALIL
jgi:hypothetical protein